MIQVFIFHESDTKHIEANTSFLIAWLRHGISAATLKKSHIIDPKITLNDNAKKR